MIRRRSYLDQVRIIINMAGYVTHQTSWGRFRTVVYLRRTCYGFTKMQRLRRHKRRHHNQILLFHQLFAHWAANYQVGANLAKSIFYTATTLVSCNVFLVDQVCAPSQYYSYWGLGRCWTNATHLPVYHVIAANLYRVGRPYLGAPLRHLFLAPGSPPTPTTYQIQYGRYTNLLTLIRWTEEFDVVMSCLMSLYLNMIGQVRLLLVLTYFNIKC